MYTYPCDMDPANAPAFTIGGTRLKLSAEDFNDGPADDEGKMCRSIIHGGSGKGGLLGVQFMRSWVPIFQWGEKTRGKEVGKGAGVGFAKVCRGEVGGVCEEIP